MSVAFLINGSNLLKIGFYVVHSKSATKYTCISCLVKNVETWCLYMTVFERIQHFFKYRIQPLLLLELFTLLSLIAFLVF